MFYQQGDLILTVVGNVKGKATDKHVLAEGEATGHAHVATATSEIQVELYDCNGTLYLRTSGPTTIEHQEHAGFVVPAGVYRIARVQEYDHFLEEARDVQD